MTLLSIGSSISVIPRILYTPCVDDPIEKLPFDHRYPEFQESGKAWCRPWVSLKLPEPACLVAELAWALCRLKLPSSMPAQV
ncbi:hypothetical protein K469DRAFT_70581 [Zopfia rhizophila CBS 207.26]|uniref:Uncharacterized protein n=1 Tax=Zopfia rhizophila CBS 207.26 TaxID=1314779 RepID=A0A6A6EDA0_9PEZI|nr:hypothetical protein K469DRAFT_70581 [Zopfia rhizophila CBS 207.26]